MSNRRPTSSKISFRNKFFRIGLKRKNTDTGQPRYERFFDNEDLPWELIKNNRSCTVFPSSSTSLTSHNTLNFKGSGRESFEIQLSPNDFVDYDSTGTGCSMGKKHYYMALRKNKVNLKDKSKKKKLNKQLTKISEITQTEIKNNNSSILSSKVNGNNNTSNNNIGKIIISKQEELLLNKRLEEFDNDKSNDNSNFSLVYDDNDQDIHITYDYCKNFMDSSQIINKRTKEIEKELIYIEEKKNIAQIEFLYKIHSNLVKTVNIQENLELCQNKKRVSKSDVLEGIKLIPKCFFHYIKRIFFPKFGKNFFKKLFEANKNYKIEITSKLITKHLINKYFFAKEIFKHICNTRYFKRRSLNTNIFFHLNEKNSSYCVSRFILGNDLKYIPQLPSPKKLTLKLNESMIRKKKNNRIKMSSSFIKSEEKKGKKFIESRSISVEPKLKLFPIFLFRTFKSLSIKNTRNNSKPKTVAHSKSPSEQDQITKHIMSKESTVLKSQNILSEKRKEPMPIENVLFLLIQEKNFEEFTKICYTQRVNYEYRDPEGNTLLNYSAKCNEYEFVDYLLQKGSNINTTNAELNTPLHNALKNKNYKIADLLIKCKADESILNIYKMTPWQYMNE